MDTIDSPCHRVTVSHQGDDAKSRSLGPLNLAALGRRQTHVRRTFSGAELVAPEASPLLVGGGKREGCTAPLLHNPRTHCLLLAARCWLLMPHARPTTPPPVQGKKKKQKKKKQQETRNKDDPLPLVAPPCLWAAACLSLSLCLSVHISDVSFGYLNPPRRTRRKKALSRHITHRQSDFPRSRLARRESPTWGLQRYSMLTLLERPPIRPSGVSCSFTSPSPAAHAIRISRHEAVRCICRLPYSTCHPSDGVTKYSGPTDLMAPKPQDGGSRAAGDADLAQVPHGRRSQRRCSQSPRPSRI